MFAGGVMGEEETLSSQKFDEGKAKEENVRLSFHTTE